MFKRLAAVMIVFSIAFSLIYMRIFDIMFGDVLEGVSLSGGTYSVRLPEAYPNIYDCNMNLLNNQQHRIYAVIKPDPETLKNLLPYVEDAEELYKKAMNGTPFLHEVTREDIANPNVFTFKSPIRYSENQLAPHILGYRDMEKGVTGIERAFNTFMEENASQISVRFTADANSNILEGKGMEIKMQGNSKAGIITTLDTDIQLIAEKSAEKISKGAVVVTDVKSGEIKACVSVPEFSPDNIAAYLDDENSPMINRAFTPYSVGSVFKMVTAATAIEEGISPDFQYECVGKTEVGNKIYNCHKHDGHGVLDMAGAVAESCNPYFIELSKYISDEEFISKASSFGFGRRTYFAEGLSSSAGNLQSIAELENEGEKANLSFGQGRLTGTPVQVNLMTCAIANYGKLPQAQLIKGKTLDGKEIYDTNEVIYTNVLKPSTAVILRNFMSNTINSESTISARPDNTTAGGKTSTAQTGRYDKDGNEYLNAWFTGYFPELKPKYAITVLVEDGGSGITAAGPVFKEIAEEITLLEQGREQKKKPIG